MQTGAVNAARCWYTKEGRNDVTEKSKNRQLEQFGFGPNVMKKTKVCPNCGQLASARSVRCPQCGTRLPFATLFDRYKRRHPCCPHCGTILTADTKYCPHCGRSINAAAATEKE